MNQNHSYHYTTESEQDHIAHSHESHTHAHHDHSHHIADFKRRFWVSLVLTLPILALSEMIQMWLHFRIAFPFQGYILLILSAVVYLYGGSPFIKGTFDEVRARTPGMMTLIGTAITIAFFYSAYTVFARSGGDFFWELATLIDVMLLGHFLEAKSVMGASRAVEELARIMPTKAHIVRDGDVIDVSVSDLKVGDIVLIRPGEKVPSDGTVIDGESHINEALLTGESKPSHKMVGSRVIGGSINVGGALKVKIEKTGDETYLAQVIELVRRVSESRSRTQDLANRAAALLFYVALGVGIITYTIWFILENPLIALERSVTVLVIACPHALGLAIPLVVALSTSITAKSGILIRDRKTFEDVKDVSAVVFDKTGTLTVGDFGVSDVISIGDEKELLELTGSVEMNSEHIIAKAVTTYAKDMGISFKPVDDFEALLGKGAYGKVNGKDVHVGGPGLLEEMGIKVDDERIKRLSEQGKTVVYTIVNGKLAGAFALSDKIRDEAGKAVSELKKMGVRVYMLTGDSDEVAKWVAGELGIDEYFSQVLPHEKADKVLELKKRGYKVAMVGDGINDAPALVTADVGIVIGAGTDVAIESADIILIRNDPRDVIKVIDLSRKTFSKMVQNLWWAGGYNIIAIPLAAGVLKGLGIVINPAIGAILMSLSTVIVALNAQTLRKYEPEGVKVVKEKEELVIDPVCKMKIEKASTYGSVNYEGKDYYFCSRHCEDEFKTNPERYVSK
ncbi:MAG: copper-translocating P-type ATPase [bacterium]